VTQDVWGGKRYKAEFTLQGTKGGTGGNVQATIAQVAGNATVEFLSHRSSTNYVDANRQYTTTITAYFKTTLSGSLGLALQATSTGSDLAIAANQASIAVSMV